MTTDTAQAAPPASANAADFNGAFIENLKAQLAAMEEATRLDCALSLFGLSSSAFAGAVEQGLASLLPKIKTIEWCVEYEHDDQGSMYSFINSVAYTREDGAEVSFESDDNEIDFFIRSVFAQGKSLVTDPEAIEEPCLRVFCAIEAGNYEDLPGPDDPWAAAYQAFSEFTGCDPDQARALFGKVWECAMIGHEHSVGDSFKLR